VEHFICPTLYIFISNLKCVPILMPPTANSRELRGRVSVGRAHALEEQPTRIGLDHERLMEGKYTVFEFRVGLNICFGSHHICQHKLPRPSQPLCLRPFGRRATRLAPSDTRNWRIRLKSVCPLSMRIATRCSTIASAVAVIHGTTSAWPPAQVGASQLLSLSD